MNKPVPVWLAIAGVLVAAGSANGIVVFDVVRTIDARANLVDQTSGESADFINEDLSHTGITSGAFPTLSGSVTHQAAADHYASYDAEQSVSVSNSDGDSTVSGSGHASARAVVPSSVPPPKRAEGSYWEPDFGGGNYGDPWFPDHGNDIRLNFDLAVSTDYELDVVLTSQATGQPGSIGRAKVWLSPYNAAFEQSGGPHNFEYNEAYFSSGSPVDTIHATGTLPAGAWTLLVTVGADATAEIPHSQMGFDNSVRVDHAFSFTLFGDASGGLIPEPTTLLIWSLLAGLGVGLGWRRRTK